MSAAWWAAIAITVLIYLLFGCMCVVSARADRNAPKPPVRNDYRRAS